MWWIIITIYLIGVIASWFIVAVHNDRNPSIYWWAWEPVFLSFGFIALLILGFIISRIDKVITNPSLKYFKKNDKIRER